MIFCTRQPPTPRISGLLQQMRSRLTAKRRGLQRPTPSSWTCFRMPPKSLRWIDPMSPASLELRSSTIASSSARIPSLKGRSCHFSVICIERSPVPGSSHFPLALLTRQPLTSPTLWVLWSRVTPPCRWLRILWPHIFHPLWLLLSRPLLPSKPCRTTSALIGKSYIAAGQAGMALHTMAILQAYQADVLKEMDEGTGLTPEAAKELRRATDLALRATKHTARAVGRSMAASVVAERHLWLNLTEIREKEKVFLMDAPISQSGLFGEAVSAVVDKFRSAKTQSAARKQFMPRRARDFSTPSSSVSREQPLPRREPPSGGAQATRPPPTTVLGARGRSSSRQQPRKRVNMKRPNKPAASANPGRSWPPGRNEESRFTATGLRVSLLQCTEPMPATRQPSTSLSVIPSKDAEGSPSRWRVPLLPGLLDTPSQVCLPLYDTMIPLSHFLHEWERLPGVSLWVLRTIRTSYTLQFGKNPPRFDGVHLTVVNSAAKASVLQQELSSLLQKGAIEEVPQLEVERGFFSRYFLVPKRDGGLRPILDLRHLNLSLYKGKFKMLTMRTIMSQVQEGDWFVTIDLKDAYFHIQVVHRHRRFLWFAFGGKAYQNKVLPFGHLPNAWMLHWPLWGSRASVYWTIWTTGSFWLTPGS